MKRLIILISFLVLVCGCGKSSSNRGAVELKQNSIAQNWTQVSEVRSCEAVSPGACMGEYGFTMDQNGNYTVGPDPSGNKLTGVLESNDLKMLNEGIGALAASIYSLSQVPLSCPSGNIPGVGGEIDLTIDGAKIIICPNTGNPTAAANLENLLGTLLAKYYPNPFQ